MNNSEKDKRKAFINPEPQPSHFNDTGPKQSFLLNPEPGPSHFLDPEKVVDPVLRRAKDASAKNLRIADEIASRPLRLDKIQKNEPSHYITNLEKPPKP